jgi:hypothetical protein
MWRLRVFVDLGMHAAVAHDGGVVFVGEAGFVRIATCQVQSIELDLFDGSLVDGALLFVIVCMCSFAGGSRRSVSISWPSASWASFLTVGGSFANDFWKRELDASMRSTMSALIFLS